MGIAEHEEAFLRAAARDGVRFDRAVMLGRQRWGAGYAEPLFESLGATVVRSIDASAYEHASDVHDLNEPLPEGLAAQFTVAVESGTVEHVFNLTEALRSAMRLPKVGGHLVFMTPCNNAPGHGLHQLTPELLYRTFSPDHGYTVKRFLLRENRGRWYEVRDPAVVGRRCEFRTRRTAYLFVLAERTADVPLFPSWPQQSDYSAEWAGQPPTMSRSARLLTHTARLRRLAYRVRARSWPPYYTRRPDNFRRVDL
jgi:SAM-dependent methyltransferase